MTQRASLYCDMLVTDNGYRLPCSDIALWVADGIIAALKCKTDTLQGRTLTEENRPITHLTVCDEAMAEQI